MTKEKLAETLTKNFEVKDYIMEATAYAHKRCPDIPPNVDAYDDNKFWGAVTSYLVAVAKR